MSLSSASLPSSSLPSAGGARTPHLQEKHRIDFTSRNIRFVSTTLIVGLCAIDNIESLAFRSLQTPTEPKDISFSINLAVGIVQNRLRQSVLLKNIGFRSILYNGVVINLPSVGKFN